MVVRPGSARELAVAVAAARRRGLLVSVQATGHGAGRGIGSGTILVDTRDLNRIRVDPAGRTARAGAGVVWAELQHAAEPHGLLGPGGTSPTVGIAGYTFGGGVGWLARPHGLGSAALLGVEYVDGAGNLRRATETAPDPADREALWAFRGGSPPGIATELEIRLFPVPDLWAGFMLWPAERAGPLARAWTAALATLAPAVTSTLALLRLPPAGPFPDWLLGTTVVHLSYASVTGERDLRPLLEAMAAVATPAVDTTGPADAARLASIHLDPPGPVASRGMGRWLTEDSTHLAADLFEAAKIGSGDGLSMVELRHVAATAAGPEGAMTTAPAPFLLHAVGLADSVRDRQVAEAALDRLEAAAAPVDLGRAAVSFRDGDSAPGDAYPDGHRQRLLAIAGRLDPGRILRFERAPSRDH
jgi:FAD/FMN-containing dehydrogenase